MFDTHYDLLTIMYWCYLKNDFSYIGGAGCMGEGPNEITTIGPLMIDERHRRIYVSDYGKNAFYIFELDSVIVNPNYFPREVIKMGVTNFPDRFFYVNDSMAYVRSIMVNGGEHSQQSVAEWNIKTGGMFQNETSLFVLFFLFYFLFFIYIFISLTLFWNL